MLVVLCGCQPAWCLSLYQLRIVGSDTVRNLQYQEVHQDSMQQKLAKSPSDFHFLVLAIVRKGVCNYCSIIFVDNVTLGGASGEYDHVATDCNSCADEWRCKNVFVVNDPRVDPAESHICHCLPLIIGFLRADTIGVVLIAILEMADHFPFYS